MEVQFSHSVMSDSLQPHGLQHARLPCPSPTPRVYSDSCPLSRWCHPTNSPSAVPFSSCLQSFPASGSFPVSQFFVSGGQSIGVSASASVLTMNTQDWCPLGWTGWISLQSKGLSRVFSNTTIQKHQFKASNVGSHQGKIPHVQEQRRSPSKMVGEAKSCLGSNPTPARDAWRAQTNLVRTRTQRPHRAWARSVFEFIPPMEVWVSGGLPQRHRLWMQ